MVGIKDDIWAREAGEQPMELLGLGGKLRHIRCHSAEESSNFYVQLRGGIWAEFEALVNDNLKRRGRTFYFHAIFLSLQLDRTWGIMISRGQKSLRLLVWRKVPDKVKVQRHSK